MKDKKKMKLSIDDLKIESFVTSLNKNQQRLIVGGETSTPACPTQTACWTNCKKTLAC